MTNDCVYLGDEQPGKLADNGCQLHECLVHGECTVEGEPLLRASCPSCRDRLPRNRRHFATRFRDRLRVTDSTHTYTDALSGMLRGCPAFLVCGGPSAKEQPLDRLAERGVWSLAVNNAAGFGKYGPNAFVCSDPASKFCDGIWMDPRIMKLIPTPKIKRKRNKLRRKRLESQHMIPCPKGKKCRGDGCEKCGGTGEVESWFETLEIDGNVIATYNAPNVWAFERRSWMEPDDSFFLVPQASWGNHNDGVKRTGEKKTVCTMLLGLRLLYYFGARVIFLVGVDFVMNPHRGLLENYSFGEERDRGACGTNNAQFRVVNEWLCRMVEDEVFKDFGLKVYNTNPNSGLRAFEHVPFDAAIMEAKKNLPPEPFDLRNWYEK